MDNKIYFPILKQNSVIFPHRFATNIARAFSYFTSNTSKYVLLNVCNKISPFVKQALSHSSQEKMLSLDEMSISHIKTNFKINLPIGTL